MAINGGQQAGVPANSFAEFSSEGVMVLSLSGQVIVFNKTAAEILALNQHEVLNQPYAQNFFTYPENDDFNQVVLNVFLQQLHVDMLLVRYFTGSDEKLLFMKCRLLHTDAPGIPEKTGLMIIFCDVSTQAEIARVLKTSELLVQHGGDDLVAASQESSAHPALISLQQVTKNYRMGEVPVSALHETTLEIYSSELLVILGPSGCGKSTLLNLIGGMDQPTDGSVIFDGLNLGTAGDSLLTRYRRQEVGFVFQFYHLIPDLTAAENVLLAAELVDDPLQLEEVFREVGLAHRMDHFPSQLSGGEQQRVSIARAIIKRPKILLCDEPTGALDSTSGKSVLELLERLARTGACTVVIVTHNMAIAAVADRIIKMRNGQLVEMYKNPYPIPAAQIEL